MATVQLTNLNAFYADLADAEADLVKAKGAVEVAKARLVEAGGKVPKVEKPEAEKKAPAKKGNGKK